MSSSENKTSDLGIIKTLGSLEFGLMAIIAVVIVAMIGTIIPQGRSVDFYQDRYGLIVNFLISVFRFNNTYRSPLFIGLLGLLGLNLILCSLFKFPAVLRKTFKPHFTPNVRRISSMPINFSFSEGSLDNVQEAFNDAGFPLHRVDDYHLYGVSEFYYLILYLSCYIIQSINI